MTERLHFHFSLSCIGERNGNPLQGSCLENPRDGGAWWAAVYGVTQSWTRLKRLSSSSKVNLWASLVAQMVKNPLSMQATWVWYLGWEDALEKGMTNHSLILSWRILMKRGASVGYSPWGCKESDMTEQLSTAHKLSCRAGEKWRERKIWPHIRSRIGGI